MKLKQINIITDRHLTVKDVGKLDKIIPIIDVHQNGNIVIKKVNEHVNNYDELGLIKQKISLALDITQTSILFTIEEKMEFKELVQLHYDATRNRGKITDRTTQAEFIAKQAEEDKECIDILDTNTEKELSKEYIQEKIDSIAVRINELTHFGVDFIKEFQKNTHYQVNRED